MIKHEKWGFHLEKRRKRRRRRRQGFDRLEPEEDENAEPETEDTIIGGASSRSGFLSRLEEVQLCLYLKVLSSMEDSNYLSSLVLQVKTLFR